MESIDEKSFGSQVHAVLHGPASPLDIRCPLGGGGGGGCIGTGPSRRSLNRGVSVGREAGMGWEGAGKTSTLGEKGREVRSGSSVM